MKLNLQDWFERRVYFSGQLYQPEIERTVVTLLRKGDRYEPISWDEAIDVIAQRISAAPDRFAFYGSGQWTISRRWSMLRVSPVVFICLAISSTRS